MVKMSSSVVASMPPDNISARNKTNLILTVGFFIISIVLDDFLNVISAYGWFIVYFMLFNIFKKMVQYQYINGELDFQSFCSHTFDFNKLTVVITFIAILTIGFSSNIKGHNNLPVFFGVLSLLEFAKYDDCKFLTSCWIECPTGINYATGMAYSFFFGYLNITLPDNGDDNVGFREMMEKYESVQQVIFPVKKIFILVPTQLHCPPNLADACQGSTDIYLESCESLGVVQRSVAGVTNRQYKHSVYKIHTNDGGLPIYVVAECATPLHTYYKVIERSGPHQEHYERHKQDVVMQFYKSLKQIIANSIECRNLCEVVYFDNANPKTNAARVLMDKIYAVREDR